MTDAKIERLMDELARLDVELEQREERAFESLFRESLATRGVAELRVYARGFGCAGITLPDGCVKPVRALTADETRLRIGDWRVRAWQALTAVLAEADAAI